jgi:molybdopterin-binding protein
MTKDFYSASEAAQTLGISLDTLRKWDRKGLIETTRDSANRRVIAGSELERLRPRPSKRPLSARNRFPGIVREVRIEGLVAQVELAITEPTVVTAIITADSAHELRIKPGDPLVAVVKATSVMVEH